MGKEEGQHKGWRQFSGIIGAVLLIFGFLGGLVSSFSSLIILFHLLVGFLTLSLWWFFFRIKKPRDKSSHTTGRRARFGLNALLYSVVFFGILTAINWLGFQDRYKFRHDFTKTARYSLSDQTLKLISSLKKPVKIIAFIGEARVTESHKLLDLYRYHSSKVEVQYIDPSSKPHLIEKYGMSEGESVYLEYGAAPDPVGISRLETVEEEEITNAILKLTRGVAKKVYFVVGHEEPRLEDGHPFGLQLLANSIKNDHFDLQEIILAQHQAIPADAAAVILYAPKFPLMDSEREQIITYAEGGGRLILVGDPEHPDGKASVSSIATAFKIKYGSDVVIDEVERPFGGATLGTQPIIRTFEPHPVTKAFSKQNIVVLNTASTVELVDQNQAGAVEFMHTGESSWSEADLPSLFGAEPRAEFDAASGDQKGPLSMAVALEKYVDTDEEEGEVEEANTATEPEFDKVTRIVAFGDADWLLNANIPIYSNRDLFLNALNWVAGEEGGIVLRPKDLKSSRVPLDRGTYLEILTWSFLFPEFLLLFGLSIWWRRRLA